MSLNNPLDQSGLRVYASSATSDGAAGGTTIVCSDLTSMPDYDGNLVILTSGTYKGKASFINGATDGGTITVFDAFGGIIKSGDKFAIFGIKGASASTIGHKVSYMEFWSTTEEVLDLPAAPTDINCPDIVVSEIPSGSSLLKVLGMVQFRKISNLNAGGNNAIQGAQNIRIKKSTGAWGADDVVFFPLVDNQWDLAASTSEGGGIFIADDGSDCKSEVDGNATYNVRFEDAKVDLDTLTLYDMKVGLKIWFV